MNMLRSGMKLGTFPGLYFVPCAVCHGRDLQVEPDFLATVNDHERGKAYMQGGWHLASPHSRM